MRTGQVTRAERVVSGVKRDGALWWFGARHCKFDDLPQHIKEPLSVLLTTAVGYYNELVGRRVTEDVFWVYHK